MTEFTRENEKLYNALRTHPDAVSDPEAKRLYAAGLADREMPDEGDTFEWAAWVAGQRTRLDQGLS